ncbi:MAG TPA: GTP 3',8-cyclase MoaA [Lachnospiraceae bacterium]|nr:GTP 3',8-cyclase MoaA [Lachnospiraceae bacterium]
MKDQFNREIYYMRVSVTDRCNFRCTYCMPSKGVKYAPPEELLTFDEIRTVCEEAAVLGIRRIKLTGGEPLMRPGLHELAAMLSELAGIEQVTLTTNGSLLGGKPELLKKGMLNGINISLDTMDPVRFRKMTGTGELKEVLKGTELVRKAGIPLKLNTVLYPGDDWKSVLRFAGEEAVDIRFIEMMPLGRGREYAGASREEVLLYIKEHYGSPVREKDTPGNGPAEYYRVPGLKNRIGIIAPIHGVFCESCNRIRLSATGKLKPCLCYRETADIRSALRTGGREYVRQKLKETIEGKPEAHAFNEYDRITEKRLMASIGG